MKRQEELVTLLNQARDAYYDKNQEIMSNFEYDKLWDELVALEKESGVVLPNSPTQEVGYKEVVTQLKKVAHAVKALSLDKTKEVPTLLDWMGDKPAVLSWKLDGLTLQLTYKNGKLVQALTRGNGEIGEDVIHMAKHPNFKGIPTTIPVKDEIIVRGEAVLSYGAFETINEKLSAEEQYKNPRNLASGTLRSLDSSVLNDRELNFIGFELVTGSKENDLVKRMELLESWGFGCVNYLPVTKETAESAIKTWEKEIETMSKSKGNQPDIPVDGLVFSFQDVAYGASLGSTSHHARSGMAFKFQDEEKETTVREIFWSASRTGLINPVAVFDPVELEGTTVSRASVHNITILKQLECGAGAKVKVYKANMIIPQISTVTQKANIEIPDVCPICGGKTTLKTSASGVEQLYCENPNCNIKKVKNFERFCERNAMNIEGISEATLETFIRYGFLTDFDSLYHLDEKRDSIIVLEGFGERSYEKIWNSIQKSKAVKMSNFLYALGIDNFGKDATKTIAKNLTLDEFYHRVNNEFTFQDFDGIGNVIDKSIHDWFFAPCTQEDTPHCAVYLKLVDLLDIQNEVKDTSEESLNGLIFVVTGSVHHFPNRDALKEFIAERGGKVAGSVSAKTNYLINDDTTSTSGKNKKAKELGIPIISEEEFLKMV